MRKRRVCARGEDVKGISSWWAGGRGEMLGAGRVRALRNIFCPHTVDLGVIHILPCMVV